MCELPILGQKSWLKVVAGAPQARVHGDCYAFLDIPPFKGLTSGKGALPGTGVCHLAAQCWPTQVILDESQAAHADLTSALLAHHKA